MHAHGCCLPYHVQEERDYTNEVLHFSGRINEFAEYVASVYSDPAKFADLNIEQLVKNNGFGCVQQQTTKIGGMSIVTYILKVQCDVRVNMPPPSAMPASSALMHTEGEPTASIPSQAPSSTQQGDGSAQVKAKSMDRLSQSAAYAGVLNFIPYNKEGLPVSVTNARHQEGLHPVAVCACSCYDWSTCTLVATTAHMLIVCVQVECVAVRSGAAYAMLYSQALCAVGHEYEKVNQLKPGSCVPVGFEPKDRLAMRSQVVK